MNNPLFKPPTAPLSEDEERDITQMLAEAYQRSEAAQKSTPAPLIAKLSSLIMTANDRADS